MVFNNNELPFIWHSNGGQNNGLGTFDREEIDKLDSILRHNGAILFKGFNINSSQKIERCVDMISANAMNYIDGNSPRTKLTDKVYTSTEYPAELFISLHSELSYTNNWPSKLYFCCEIAPDKAGNTLIADNRMILQNLPEEVLSRFIDRGVKYIRNLHDGKNPTVGGSWVNTFETSERDIVEEYCNSHDIEYEWKSDGGIRLVQNRTAIAKHPLTNEEVWFNQADQFHPYSNPPDVYEAIMEIYEDNLFDMPQYACYGDDSPIDTATFDVIKEVTEKHVVYFPWEVGDLLVLDNMLISHGRSPFSGKRKILVSMSA